MTENKFDFDNEYITLDGGVFAIAKSRKDAELISKTFNQLYNENEQLKQELGEYCNFSLHDLLAKKNREIERLKSTLAYRSNQLALMEQLIDDLGHEEMKRQMEEILQRVTQFKPTVITFRRDEEDKE